LLILIEKYPVVLIEKYPVLRLQKYNYFNNLFTGILFFFCAKKEKYSCEFFDI